MHPADLLAGISLFQNLAEEDRAALGARLTEKAFEAGDLVFSQGDRASAMYIVKSGSVQIYLPGADGSAPPVLLKDLRVGDYFGELALFDEKPRSASARTLVHTTLVELTRDDLTEHLGRSTRAAMTILSEMADRLRETNAMLGTRAAKDAVKEFEENLGFGQRLADEVAKLNGSWKFILLLLGTTVAWTLVNVPSVASRLGLAPHGTDGTPLGGFDPYPYVLYNLVLTILVSLQGPLIVMSQNRQALKDRAQADTDFRVNLKNEVGIDTMLAELEAMRHELDERVETLSNGHR